MPTTTARKSTTTRKETPMPTTTTRKSTTTRARREESTMARTKTFPAYRETTRAEKPIAKLALAHGLGLLDYKLTANEADILASVYEDGKEDAATCYSAEEAEELLTYTAASQAAAMYCDSVTDESGPYGGIGLSRVALALVCYRWATGWVDGIKAMHAEALAEDAASGKGGAK